MPSRAECLVVPYSAIAAMCLSRGLGIRGNLPWRLKKEMAYFSRITTTTSAPGKINGVIMGRKTWDSIPPKYRPLADRLNVVVSRTLSKVPEGHHVVQSLPEATSLLQKMAAEGKVDKIFVIGGEQLYKLAVADPLCTRLYVTEIDADFECDVFFPAIDHSVFHEVQDDQVPQEEQTENGLTFRYKVYERQDN
ncbi:dihydrofolate reductase-like [Ornithodoros turicata]|uniref:dihydrofolate reductase-like n=1 Tax=Ornithodoros turicata TaxID=34597 RepID=UPI00313958A9